VEHVVHQRLAAELLQLSQPVGVHAVVADAVLVDVEHPVAPPLAVEGHAAVVGLERVGDRCATVGAVCWASPFMSDP